ncbi:MAG TPA: SprT-like domain-containing protein, partial [Thermoanaerobaculia bacterium]|nr:SprT-like domain-containing protein [Thermoanaerobaculia bacterium]
APRPAPRKPLQLELFGGGHPTLPAEARRGPRPTVVPSPPNPDAPRLELQRALNRLTGGRLTALILTDNRRTILSVKPGRPGDRTQLALRIHRSFLGAPPEVLQAVATFLGTQKGSDRSREALAVIRQHFGAHRPERKARRTVLRPEGETCDLRPIVDDLNQRYFGGRLRVDVTWGRSSMGEAHRCRGRGGRARTSSLQLGSYSYEDRLIRLHRVLDQPGVPRYVIEAVVFHELLHADMPPLVHNGRRYFHTPEFRQREREYRHLDKADRWIQEHLPDLLRARRNARSEAASRRPRR